VRLIHVKAQRAERVVLEHQLHPPERRVVRTLAVWSTAPGARHSALGTRRSGGSVRWWAITQDGVLHVTRLQRSDLPIYYLPGHRLLR
jgi:hypothetical protein